MLFIGQGRKCRFKGHQMRSGSRELLSKFICILMPLTNTLFFGPFRWRVTLAEQYEQRKTQYKGARTPVGPASLRE